MLLLRGAFFGLVCGAIGAAMWAAVAYFTGYELGLLAIVVGGLCGFGMGMGNAGRGGAGAGLVAAFVTFLAIMGGKFAVVQVMLDDFLQSEAVVFDEEASLDAIAGQVYQEFDASGQDMGEEGDEWPSAVWSETCARWQAMSGAEREQFTADLQRQYQTDMAAARPVIGVVAFLFSFGLMDLVFFGLALSTAFKIGATNAKARMEEQAALEGAAVADVGEFRPSSGGANLGIFGSLGRDDAGQAGDVRREAA